MNAIMSKGLGVMGSANGTEREAWGRVKARLKTELGEEVFLSWFGRAELEAISGGVVRLSVPTRFLKSWILSHYQDRLIELWRTEVGEVYRLEIGVRNAAFTAPPQQPAAAHAPPAQPAVEAVEEGLTGSPLDPRLTFETYRVGRSNALAAAAARKALEPGLHFNPLYIHSGVGLGKTHLLQAMAHAADAGKPARRVLYLTAERFMYRFVTALKANTALAFKDQLRGIDVLLIDDVQFLQGRATQNEFCHILNALIDAGRQVAVAADRPPAELESLDERVRSRLAGGLVVEIGPLDEELRYGIVAAKAEVARARYPRLQISDEVLRFLARQIAGSGRDLDGAFTRLVAHNQLTGAPVTLDLAERVARDLIKLGEAKRIRIEDIQRVVAKHYNVTRADLLSNRRTRSVVHPRQIAMYLAKTMTPRSLPEIGRRFGGRDHTTVLHAVRKIEGLVTADAALAEEIETLRRLIEA